MFRCRCEYRWLSSHSSNRDGLNAAIRLCIPFTSRSSASNQKIAILAPELFFTCTETSSQVAPLLWLSPGACLCLKRFSTGQYGVSGTGSSATSAGAARGPNKTRVGRMSRDSGQETFASPTNEPQPHHGEMCANRQRRCSRILHHRAMARPSVRFSGRMGPGVWPA